MKGLSSKDSALHKQWWGELSLGRQCGTSQSPCTQPLGYLMKYLALLTSERSPVHAKTYYQFDCKPKRMNQKVPLQFTSCAEPNYSPPPSSPWMFCQTSRLTGADSRTRGRNCVELSHNHWACLVEARSTTWIHFYCQKSFTIWDFEMEFFAKMRTNSLIEP